MPSIRFGLHSEFSGWSTGLSAGGSGLGAGRDGGLGAGVGGGVGLCLGGVFAYFEANQASDDVRNN